MLTSLLSLPNTQQLIVGADLANSAKVWIDSRKVQAGDVFVGLKGEQVDGNDYWQAALDKGARLLVLERAPDAEGLANIEQAGCHLVVVDSGEATLAAWARAYRQTVLRESGVELIGITGSNGKTSTKELLKAVLSEKFAVEATAGNYNNHLGVPLTVLSCNPEQEVLIVEMGTNHPGEIEFLCDIAQVNQGIITCVGNAHIEFLGSVAGVAKEKGALLRSLTSAQSGNKPRGFAQAHVAKRQVLSSEVTAQMLWVGENHQLEITQVVQDIKGTQFNLQTVNSSQTYPVQLPILPTVMLENIRLVIEVAYAMGMTLPQIVSGLEAFRLTAGRFEIVEADGKYWINDAYNANPDSLREAYASLQLLSEKQGDMWVVFAQMGELGEQALEQHYQLGGEASQLGFNTIAIGEGDLVQAYYQGAKSVATDTKSEPLSISHAINQEEAKQILLAQLQAGDKVLFKASRAAGLEQLFNQFI